MALQISPVPQRNITFDGGEEDNCFGKSAAPQGTEVAHSNCAKGFGDKALRSSVSPVTGVVVFACSPSTDIAFGGGEGIAFFARAKRWHGATRAERAVSERRGGDPDRSPPTEISRW